MNIKLIIVFFTIVLLFIYLYITKKEKSNNVPYINKLKGVIENFTDECNNDNIKVIKYESDRVNILETVCLI